jgi:hypothetical protein
VEARIRTQATTAAVGVNACMMSAAVYQLAQPKDGRRASLLRRRSDCRVAARRRGG